MVTEPDMQSSRVARVSVVIPCYRCKDTVRRAVDSVYQQSLRPAEVILVDDASPDDTRAFLASLAEEYPSGWIRVITLTTNAGPGTARNEGWNAASQLYIAFLDSDDSWHRQKIELQYGWMQRNPTVALTGQTGLTIEVSSAVATKHYIEKDVNFSQVLGRELLMSNRFSTPSVMLRKDLPYRFPEGKRFCEDYELWCDLCCSGFACYSMNKPLTFCYKPLYGHAGLSGNLWKMELGELRVYSVLRAKKKIRFVSYCSLTFWSLARYVRRTIKLKFGHGSV
ncbi:MULTISPECIES: glycosyltransferase family 2 protein [Pseudomonas]|uniref:Glycosyltransferase n=1 Tax=Pseudomonas azadiae TaxID=2843612 RepID=A0ABS6P232_9PSED|nr:MULTISPECIES: glycosyltransferase family 2 protein [Pseudomonas]MBV4454520.1 glycosyltransferase [Pseudomonas azadiae]NMF39680.1 glycosyltransferase family 2 protein [Pseudomonas sp. SWRI 103]